MPTRFGVLLVVAIVAGCSTTPSAPPASATASVAPTPTQSVPLATASPSPTLATTPNPTVEPSSSPVGWTRTYQRDRALLSAAHVAPSGFLGGGCVADENGTCLQALLVVSPDGARWSEVALEADTSAWIDTFAEVDGRHFAIGGRVDDARFVIEPMAWTSVDGASWTRVTIPDSTNMAIQDIVESPSGTIAIGINAPYASEGSGFITWKVGADGTFGKPRSVSVPQAFGFVGGATWLGERFLAWGDTWTSLDDEDGTPVASTVLFESTDGAAWKLLSKSAQLVNNTLGDVVQRGDRLVAVGYRGTLSPAQPGAWTSSDGIHWDLATTPAGNGALFGITIEGAKLVARGRDSDGDVNHPLAWRSNDGLAWTRVKDNELLPALANFWPPSAALIGTRRCVVGTFGIGGIHPSAMAEIHCR